jgi:choline dehydrogenase-like flavoprotein
VTAARWDVIVVGAGPAGLIVTEQLLAMRLRPLLLEAGPAAGPADDRVVAEQWPFRVSHPSCHWLRAHAVGGRAHLWGGWLSRCSLTQGAWPYPRRTLEPYYDAAERWLAPQRHRLAARHRRLADELGVTVTARQTAIEGGHPWRGQACRAARIARTDHVALRLWTDHGRAVALDIADREGRRYTARATAFVLAASPIETCRLLLASGVDRRIGDGLTDHLPMSYVLIETPRKSRSAARADAVLRGFAGPAARAGHPAELSVEISGPIPGPDLAPELRQVLGAGIARTAQVSVINAMGGLRPTPERYVALAAGALRDPLGRPLPRVQLAYGRADLAMMRAMEAACQATAQAVLAGDGELVCVRTSRKPPVIFHPAGGCVMGTAPDAACDPWGRIRDLQNVWIADASVFPSAGDSHPTLTVLAHALRAARSVGRHLATPAARCATWRSRW